MNLNNFNCLEAVVIVIHYWSRSQFGNMTVVHILVANVSHLFRFSILDLYYCIYMLRLHLIYKHLKCSKFYSF